MIGVSLKDRAAILPAGHMANGAYWFDPKSGNFVSSTYYFPDLPGWVKDFNSAQPADQVSRLHLAESHAARGTRGLYSALETSPFGNELVEQFAERALSAEQLGTRDVHGRTDRELLLERLRRPPLRYVFPRGARGSARNRCRPGRLFQAIDRQVGLANTLIVLTGDHGVAPSAAEDGTNHMPGGRLPGATVRNAVQAALAKKYGEGEWVLGSYDLAIYLNRELMAMKSLDPGAVERVAAAAAMEVPHVARVYTREQLASGAVNNDEITRRIVNGFNPQRAADLEFIPEPYWLFTGSTTTHGTPYSYDAHVPVIFLGTGIQAGRYDGNVAVNDIAPTLATILQVETPSGSIGRVLTEMFAQ